MVARFASIALAGISLLLPVRLAQAGIEATGRGATREAKVANARETFLQAINGGVLAGFDDVARRVLFKVANVPADSHEPGPMEDEVIASTLRAKAADDQFLRALKVKVECRSGQVRIDAEPAELTQIARLISLALTVDGVREVSAAVPSSLCYLPAAG